MKKDETEKEKAFVVTKVKQKLVFVPPKKFWGKKIIGAIFLILGSAILTACLFYFLIIPVFFQKECPRVSLPEETEQTPQRIFIPRLNLELPVEEAKLADGQWTLAGTGVFFLPGTTSFDKSGNVVIFGSNKVLAKLNFIKKEDKIYLFGQEKYLVFEVTETKTVLPSDEAIFGESGQKTLTLFSTSDYLKGKRFVVKGVRK